MTRVRQFLAAPQLSFGLFLGALFLIVVAAEQIGLHGSLGALLLGAALSQLPHRLRSEVLPGLRSAALGFFVPLFFAPAGLHLNASFTHLPLSTIGVVIGLAIGAKLAGSMLAPRLAGLEWPVSIGWGLMAKGAVEVAPAAGAPGAPRNHGRAVLVAHDRHAGLHLHSAEAHGTIAAEDRRGGTGGTGRHDGAAAYALDDKVVADAFIPSPVTPDASISLESFFRFWMVPEQTDYVVRQLDGKPAGVLSLKKVKEIATDEWGATSLDSVLMTRFPVVNPDEPIDDALEKMVEHGITTIPVVDEHHRGPAGRAHCRERLLAPAGGRRGLWGGCAKSPCGRPWPVVALSTGPKDPTLHGGLEARMSVASTAPANARTVYIALIVLGLVAMAVAGSVIGFISYEYVTREELRNPPPQEKGGHAALPVDLVYI